MTGLGLLQAGAGALMLASAGGGGCAVPEAPDIRVNVSSAEIVYHYNMGTAQLDRLAQQQGSTASPIPKGRDSATGGLRLDQPVVRTNISWAYREDVRRRNVCLWYDTITVDIMLNPQIFIAREKKPGPCREAILAHEHRHVQVDREVMNRFAADIGRALKQAVDETGGFGPFPASQKEQLGQELAGRIGRLMEAHEGAMQQVLNARQMEVDSLAEYERISRICQQEELGRRRR